MIKKFIITIISIIILISAGIAVFCNMSDNLDQTPVNLDNIIKNQIIKSPLNIYGQALGTWFFKGGFPVKLLDSQENEIAIGIAQAQGDWISDGYVPFRATIEFVSPGQESGYLVFIKGNPLDKPELDYQVRVPINFVKQKQTRQVNVYFIPQQDHSSDCSQVSAVSRTIEKTQAVAASAINELLKGPKQSEQAMFASAIPFGTQLVSLTINNTVAYVKFSQELQNYGGGSCNATAIRAQITNTLKQFNSIEQVEISVQGIPSEQVLQP